MRSSASFVAAAILAVSISPALSNEVLTFEEVVVQIDPNGAVVYEDAYANPVQIDGYAPLPETYAPMTEEVAYGDSGSVIVYSEPYDTGEAEYIEVPESAVIFIDDAAGTVEGTIQSY